MLDKALTAAGDLLAARGGCIGNVEVVDLMGLEDGSILDRWRDHRQIVSVRDEAGQWVYPVWQFARKHKRIMLGIRDCLAELPIESESQLLIFFLNRMESLDGHSPLDCLRSGKIEAAIKAARQYGWSRRAVGTTNFPVGAGSGFPSKPEPNDAGSV
jgi:hypothetical protein